MYRKNMTYMKVKNDVDNSVDNVENVTWYSGYSDASSLKITKKVGVILGIIAKKVKELIYFAKNPKSILTE